MIVAQALIEKGMLDGLLMSFASFTREAMVTFQQNPVVSVLLLVVVILLIMRSRR